MTDTTVLHHMWKDETGRWRERTYPPQLTPLTARLIAEGVASATDARTERGASSPNDD